MSLEILAFVLAGGKGTRLGPLCDERAKPAVIFGGKYRIIDFVLNNMVNSGIYRIKVLTQFKSDSLNKHLSNGWQLNRFLGQYIDAVPAQMRTGEDWYRGTADAIYQNLNLIYENDPTFIAVFGGDHIYKMDVRQMLKFHKDKGAVATVAAIPVPKAEASEFGIIHTDENDRIIAFVEKPKNPPEIPGRPGWCYASMGNYLFTTETIVDVLKKDAANPSSSHDFGKDMLPFLHHKFPVYAYNFAENRVPGANPEEHGYWRDVGTVDAYFEANMDLRSVKPIFNLYNYLWPLRTTTHPFPPAKFVFSEPNRKGEAIDSIVSEGSIISGGRVINSVLSPRVFVHSYSELNECIVFGGAHIGRRAKLRRVIVDRNVRIPENAVIGYNPEEDRKKYYVSPSGIVIIPAEKAEDAYERLHPHDRRHHD